MGNSVNDIDDAVLLRRAVGNARSRHCRKGQAHARWSAVADAFALGSVFSMELCRRFGFDPEEMIKK
jgi:hypothetical protein